MSLYVRVQDQQVVEGPRTLPKIWQNISNFPALSDTEKIAHGWYLANITRPDFDSRIKMQTGPEYIIHASYVDVVWTVQDQPLLNVKTDLVTKLKEETRNRIYVDGAPEYAQRNAALGLLSQEEVDAIKNTISTRRAACNTTEAEINAATTGEVAVAVYDVWANE